MADSISDNRTPINNADSNTNWTLSNGATGTTTDNDTFIEGLGSQTFNLSNAIDGLLYNMGTTVDLTGNSVYIWFNCGIAGKLDTLAGGGVRVRFCGPTASDFFEVAVLGKDTYSGGWVMLVVDVDAAAASPFATGGTPPAKTAIQRIGVIGDTAGFMSKKQDNFWVDAMWRLPANTPGILVEGRNGGSTPWAWSDVLAASVASAWGTAQQSDGGTIVLNTPIRFGTNDATTHAFLDTNSRIEWADLPVNSNLYGLTVVGGSGSQSFVMGVKTGTGDAAAGSQGCIIGAKASGVRWYLDADDANIDACGLYGCTFLHGSDFQLDGANVETLSTAFVDCTAARVDNSLFQRNQVIDANTGDGVAFLTTDDLGDVRFCTFLFSDGHAVELTTPRVASQESRGNKFTGYGTTGTNDAAVYNNTGGAVTISVTQQGDGPTYRNGSGASTTVNNSVTLTVTVKSPAGNAVSGARVRIQLDSDQSLVAEGTTNTSGIFTDTYDFSSDVDVNIIVRLKGFQPFDTDGTITANGLPVNVTFLPDPTVYLP